MCCENIRVDTCGQHEQPSEHGLEQVCGVLTHKAASQQQGRACVECVCPSYTMSRLKVSMRTTIHVADDLQTGRDS